MSNIKMNTLESIHAFEEIMGQRSKERLIRTLHWWVAVMLRQIEREEGMKEVLWQLGENLGLDSEEMRAIGINFDPWLLAELDD